MRGRRSPGRRAACARRTLGLSHPPCCCRAARRPSPRRRRGPARRRAPCRPPGVAPAIQAQSTCTVVQTGRQSDRCSNRLPLGESTKESKRAVLPPRPQSPSALTSASRATSSHSRSSSSRPSCPPPCAPSPNAPPKPSPRPPGPPRRTRAPAAPAAAACPPAWRRSRWRPAPTLAPLASACAHTRHPRSTHRRMWLWLACLCAARHLDTPNSWALAPPRCPNRCTRDAKPRTHRGRSRPESKTGTHESAAAAAKP